MHTNAYHQKIEHEQAKGFLPRPLDGQVRQSLMLLEQGLQPLEAACASIDSDVLNTILAHLYAYPDMFMEAVMADTIDSGNMARYPEGWIDNEPGRIRMNDHLVDEQSSFRYYRKGALKNLPEFLADLQSIRWNCQWIGEVQIDAVQSAEAVLSVLVNSQPGLKQMLLNSVALGGDVDTVASLVMAIGSQSEEIENDLPRWMTAELDEDQYGIGYLNKTDEKLMAMFPGISNLKFSSLS